MTVFRPCIDLHDGKVKQIVGGTLRDEGEGPRENFVSEQPASWFAERYRTDGLLGGHVIKLGAGNEAAAIEALAAWPSGLQLGGGVTLDNAAEWLARGAAKVIVTSWLFVDKRLDLGRVEALARAIGPEHLVVDLSCRRVAEGWRVATDRWQTVTETPIDGPTLATLAPLCSELLVHAADVEGRCEGIDEALVAVLGAECPLPCTYAGGGRDIADLARVAELSGGRVDLTYGSALDLFGGSLVRYADCVAWNRAVDTAG
ncbi:MAG: phosphoribosylformimino-5-aminoimidazole carboxamide ribotide isomerase [Sandaracinaceae bacterium]|nr:phosphoribosylformimino-5-aminoimidazole carboxamide ribotide isomerase [Myxococcales bacterium]MCB9657107.1 phosphoribosylformimino-5-aminoimidazole carboxamide ribotide isomerase [Sandaracinaceae bacterium]